ncbi:MAG: DUF11 domain-containing protein [Christensenellales bacterium]
MIIPNQSETQFDYTLPDGQTKTETRESNIVNTEILTYSFTKVKSSDRTFLQEGEIATQTVVLTNNSQVNISNIIFKDILSGGGTYVAGSVIVNGVAQPSYDLVAGFPIDDLSPNEFATISYKIQANNPLTEALITNYANIGYTANERNLNENSNTINLVVVSNRLTIVKAVDKSVAIAGENLHYTSTITNTGTLLKTNLIFTDDIPAGTTFVAGSVKIDGVTHAGYNPAVGFALPDLIVGASTVVEFDVKVN